MAHALSLAEVMDVTNMDQQEERWWSVFVHSSATATGLLPKLERQRCAGLAKARASQYELFEQMAALRLESIDASMEQKSSSKQHG